MWACRYQIAATCPKYTLFTEQSSQESRKYIYGICFLNLSSKATYNHSFTHSQHSFTHSQPRRAPASSSCTVRVSRLAQGHLDTQRGGAGERTSNLPVTSQPAPPPEPLPPPAVTHNSSYSSAPCLYAARHG